MTLWWQFNKKQSLRYKETVICKVKFLAFLTVRNKQANKNICSRKWQAVHFYAIKKKYSRRSRNIHIDGKEMSPAHQPSKGGRDYLGFCLKRVKSISVYMYIYFVTLLLNNCSALTRK